VNTVAERVAEDDNDTYVQVVSVLCGWDYSVWSLWVLWQTGQQCKNIQRLGVSSKNVWGLWIKWQSV
jgi:hypothetical protein